MYTQFFGNFLLNKGVVSPTQLLEAMNEKSSARIKIGTLAMHAGLMTANEVDNIVIMQTHQDKRFGELAVSEGYLSKEQLDSLLNEQIPEYLLLGQILIEKGYLSNTDFENLIIDYQSENELMQLEDRSAIGDNISHLMKNFCRTLDDASAEYAHSYLELFFNNLIRFIGDDFMPMSPFLCPEYPAVYAVTQHIEGKVEITSTMDMDEQTAIGFASRYVSDTFHSFDEYVKASIEDFINLHNGLYIVNVSNESAMELHLTPPTVQTGNTILPLPAQSYLIPLVFPFGTINFIFSVKEK